MPFDVSEKALRQISANHKAHPEIIKQMTDIMQAVSDLLELDEKALITISDWELKFLENLQQHFSRRSIYAKITQKQADKLEEMINKHL